MCFSYYTVGSQGSLWGWGWGRGAACASEQWAGSQHLRGASLCVCSVVVGAEV